MAGKRPICLKNLVRGFDIRPNQNTLFPLRAQGDREAYNPAVVVTSTHLDLEMNFDMKIMAIAAIRSYCLVSDEIDV